MNDMNEINSKIKKLMNNMDPKSLDKGFKAVSDLLKTNEGRQLANKLKGLDKEKLMKTLNDSSLSSRLDSVDPRNLSRQLDNLDTNKIVNDVTRDPNLAKKINKFLKDK